MPHGQASHLRVYLDPPPNLLESVDPVECFAQVAAHAAVLKAATLMSGGLRVYNPPGDGVATLHANIPWKLAEHRSDLPPRLLRSCAEVVTLIRHGDRPGALFLDRGVLASVSPERFHEHWPPALENPELDVAAIARLLVSKYTPPRTIAAIGSSPSGLTIPRTPTLHDWLAARIDVFLDAEQLSKLPSPVAGSWSVADLLALAELSATPPGSALLDERSSEILETAISHGWRRATKDGASDGQIALSIAPAYALRVLPGLADHPADLVLEWRDTLGDSLDAFRQRIADFSAAFQPVDSPTQARRQLENIGAQLDRDFAELRREAQATQLWRATQDQAPTMAGRAAAVGVSFGAGFGHPAIGLVALLSASITQGVTMAFDLAKRRQAMQAHPLHWRYVLGEIGEENLRTWRRLAKSNYGMSRRRAFLALYDVPATYVPKMATADEDNTKRTKLLTWPSEDEWGDDVEEAIRGLTADQVDVLALLARMELESRDSDALFEAAMSQSVEEFEQHRDQLEERGIIEAAADPDFPGNVIARLSERGINAARLFTARGAPPAYLGERATQLRAQTRHLHSDDRQTPPITEDAGDKS
jgi:hypothetical protein